jgi:cobalt-zinc-cadmium efflux system protein
MADHSHGLHRGKQSMALWIALIANGGFVIAEVIGGLVFNSLVLLADAAHMLSDVFGLAIALVAQGLISRPASARHTFGFQRAEVLGAQANGVTLLVASGWIFYEAVRRLDSPEPVQGIGLMVVASLSLLVNVGSAVIIGRAQGRSLNMRGAFMHMVVDAAGSVGAMSAGLAVTLWDASWADPLVSMAIGVLVLWSAVRLLHDTAHVLLEGTPRGIRLDDVERALQGDRSVDLVHHVHLWNLASDVPAMSAHVVLAEEPSLHDAQVQGNRLRRMLRDEFGIDHATLGLECHSCEDESTPVSGVAES